MKTDVEDGCSHKCTGWVRDQHAHRRTVLSFVSGFAFLFETGSRCVALHLQSSCLCLPNAGITAVCACACDTEVWALARQVSYHWSRTLNPVWYILNIQNSFIKNKDDNNQ
jgi:hypothetical protein